MSELAASLQKVSTAAYQASSEPAGQDGADGSGGTDADAEAADAGAGAETEEAVEGEFKEV